MEYKGIDIANWQDGLNVRQWKDALGLTFIIIKVGGNEGGRYADRCFDGFYEQAKKCGLHVGAYYYTTTRDVANAKRDAEHCLGLLKGYDLDMPVYMDVEDARQFQLSKRDLTDVIKVFCDKVDESRKAGIYTGGNAWRNNVYKDELLQYADWIAWWADFGSIQAVKDRCGNIGMWQVGSISLSGHVAYDDVAGHQDYDICDIEYWGEKREPQKEDKDTLLPYCDEAAEVMWHKITHDAHGYSQPNRSTNYSAKETITLSDGTKVKIAAHDDDCSSGVRDCYVSIGVDVAYYTYTGNEVEGLLESGNFKRIKVRDAQNGDILWRVGHTEMLLTRNGTRYQGGFRASEYGSIDGEAGDQTGYESTYSLFDPNDWSQAFRCTKKRKGAKPQGSSDETGPDAAKNNTHGGKLDVDGWAGYNTILDLQHALGTYEDGSISGQWHGNDKYRPNVSAVKYGTAGSTMVMALQRKLGVEVDGYWGMDTSKALQKWLVSKGYKIDVDGYFGYHSVRALQKSLNDGKWS